MSIVGSEQWMYSSGAEFYDFPIEQSLRFNDDDSAYLSRTPASAGNRKTWTWSGWVKRGNLTTTHNTLFIGKSGAVSNAVGIVDNQLRFYSYNGSGFDFQKKSNAVLRDPSAWYHIVAVFDSSNATAADRARIYINGERVTSFASSSDPSLNFDGQISNNVEHTIGINASSEIFDGYMADINFIDGQALDATSFGELKSGIWTPVDTSGLTFGTNGFRLQFGDTTEASGFNTLTYSGDNINPKSVNGCGFSPDFVWVKQRTNNGGGATFHQLYDSVRGTQKLLRSNTTDAELANPSNGGVQSFDSDGFTIQGSSASLNMNGSGETYVAWCWDAGSGSPVSNTDGSITSTVKANTDYGFSIVSYTGTGANATVGHGLTSAPELVILKNRSIVSSWLVRSSELAANQTLLLENTTTPIGTDYWQNTQPDSSVITVSSNSEANGSGNNLVAYCFAEKTGYSKIGTFTGTGAAGNSITTGFKPAFVMWKSSTATTNWTIADNTRDTSNPITKRLLPNLSNAEDTAISVDFNDTGFEFNSGAANDSGETFIYIAFADTRNAAFWKDTSGQGNDWQPNNLVFSDVVPDSVSNNFPTIIKGYNQNVSEGNLKVERNANANNHVGYFSTMGMSSGKWYAEVRYVDAAIDTVTFGVAETNERFSPTDNNTAYAAGSRTGISVNSYVDWATYGVEAKKYSTYNGTNTSYGVAAVSGDIFMLAVDMDNNKFWVGKNGTWMASGNPAAGTNPTHEGAAFAPENPMVFVGSFYTGRVTDIRWNFGQDSTFAGNTTAGGNQDENGYGDFKYAPPSGFLSLCTANLPTGAIDTLADETPEDYFNTVLWTGDNTTGGRSVTGVGFQPDLVYAKSRSAAYSPLLYDVLRGTGATAELKTDGTEAEGGSSSSERGYLNSFDADGFSSVVGSNGDNLYFNQTSQTYVAWNWKAGGSGVSNTDGSITSTVSVGATSQQNWFSIVSYVGNNSAGATVGHGLGRKPDILFYKNRDDGTQNWVVYTDITGTNGFLILNSTAAFADASAVVPAPNSSTFNLHSFTSNNGSGDDIICYAFANADGLCKVGKYTGNGSTDGTFVYTGFRPAFVMVKSHTAGEHWNIPVFTSNTNGTMNTLSPNLSNAERTMNQNPAVDFVSNGFKIKTSDANYNSNGGGYIFLAIAEQPFAFANAR